MWTPICCVPVVSDRLPTCCRKLCSRPEKQDAPFCKVDLRGKRNPGECASGARAVRSRFCSCLMGRHRRGGRQRRLPGLHAAAARGLPLCSAATIPHLTRPSWYRCLQLRAACRRHYEPCLRACSSRRRGRSEWEYSIRLSTSLGSASAALDFGAVMLLVCPAILWVFHRTAGQNRPALP